MAVLSAPFLQAEARGTKLRNALVYEPVPDRIEHGRLAASWALCATTSKDCSGPSSRNYLNKDDGSATELGWTPGTVTVLRASLTL